MRKVIAALMAITSIVFFGCSTDNNGTTTVVPLTPGNLTATVISTTQVNLQWADNATNETGYKVERKLLGSNFAQVATTGENIASFSDLNLTPNTTYVYRVVAYNSAGNSLQYSNEVTVTTQDTVPAWLTNGLIAFYPFSGNAGDSSGNGNHGTVNGATLTTDRFGNSGKAYDFNGTSNSISCSPAGLPIGNQPRTVSSWFRTTASVIPTNDYPNVQMINGYGSSISGAVVFPQNIVAPQGLAWFETGSSLNNIYSINSVNDGNWHNFITTYNGSGSEVKMYIDGILQGNTASININTISSNFIIGGCPWYTIYFKGQIDDVRIYNRALNQAEVTYLSTH